MKKARAEILKKGYDELDALAAYDYDVVEFSPYHFRINQKIDVWPSSRKWFNTQTGEKGVYTDLKDFIKQKLPLTNKLI